MKKRINKVNVIDYLIGILVILIFTWSPNFGHGHIVGPDEGQHLAWINEMLHGKTVYKDIYIFYGPLLESMSIIFMKIFGVSLWSLRLFYQISNILILIIGFLILKLILRTRTFLYFGLWALLSTKVTEFWMPRWGGPRLVLGLIAAWLILYYTKKGHRWPLFWAGIFTSLALFTSQEIGMVLLFSSLLFLFFLNLYNFTSLDTRRLMKLEKTRLLFKGYLLYIGGVVIAAAPIVLYLLMKGAFFDYINICFIDLPFKYPRHFVEPGFTKLLFISFFTNLKIPFVYNTNYFLYYLLSLFIYAMGLGYIIWNYAFHKMKRQELALLFVLLFGVPLLLSAFRQIIGEQIALYSLPIVATAMFLLERLFLLSKDNLAIQRKNFSIKKLVIAIVCLILIQNVCLILLIKSRPHRYLKDIFNSYLTLNKDPEGRFYRFTYTSMTAEERYARLSGEWETLDLARAKGVIIPKKQAEAISGAVEFIRKNTPPSEEIFVFPHEGEYYFLADRPSITRFTPTIYASIDINYQKEVIADLKQKKPKYCVYVQDAFVFTDYNKIPNEKRLNLIFNYLNSNYYIKKQYGETFILERKSL